MIYSLRHHKTVVDNKMIELKKVVVISLFTRQSYLRYFDVVKIKEIDRKMDEHVTVLNFDQIYRQQRFLQNPQYDWLNLDEIPHTNLLCEKDSLLEINEKIKPSIQHNKITLLGSGNYHYVAYLLLAKIEQPFTLVLFDHHTDMYPSPSESLISCGSWVRTALKALPQLNKVIMIGVGEDWSLHIPESIREKVVAFSENDIRNNFRGVIHQIQQKVETENVYLSIDKDVLNMDESVTAWDHGSMTLNQLTQMVNGLRKDYIVRGIDICGEYPLSPATMYQKQTRDILKKNELANQQIIEQSIG
ncbi:Arginase family enzyme [Salinibacillus kushneri]|uniref:Arginase family enzyme n=1 Tax=Salinibacillus kushneri TaxID=237682 RepID=A0A1I0IIN0_9BACI|nr:Arginase family enzyme [Salinibacillus kushneri]